MQLELLQGGPGVVALTVYNDFQAYSGGVCVCVCVCVCVAERDRETETER